MNIDRSKLKAEHCKLDSKSLTWQKFQYFQVFMSGKLNFCRNFKYLIGSFQEDNLPYSRSTYLIDPPTSFEQQQRYSNTFSNQGQNRPFVEDPMSLYSVVHKERKPRNSLNQSDSPCSIEHHMNYEDTESEYASELRRQTYLQKIGKFVKHRCLG